MIECPVDEFIPLPTGSRPEVDYIELRRRAQAACITAAVMHAEGHESPEPDLHNLRSYTSAAMRTVSQGHNIPAEHARAMLNTPEGAVFVNSILTRYDMEVVGDAKRLRHYVTNKLILESDHADAKIRMRALELLGKISDVGLFTERTEITVNNRSTVELENSLRDKLKRLMGSDDAEDASILNPTMPIALDGLDTAAAAQSALEGL